jgi:hypothetical protein
MKRKLKKLLIFLLKLIFIIVIFIKIIKLFRYNPKLKILLCTIAKEENKYVLEFVQHYKSIKVNKIIIYDNNEINGENFFDILKNDIKINYVN